MSRTSTSPSAPTKARSIERNFLRAQSLVTRLKFLIDTKMKSKALTSIYTSL